MRKLVLAVAVVVMLHAVYVSASETKAVEADTATANNGLVTDSEKISYIIGFQVGSFFKEGGIEVSVDAFMRAVNDIKAGKDPAMTEDQMRAMMMGFQQKMMAKRQAQMKKDKVENLAKANAFLEENASKKGVITLDSGLQYQILEKGKGNSPKDGDSVNTHYRGTLLDGSEFDNSYNRGKPFNFSVGGRVIAAWNEALLLMKEGDKFKLFVPPALGYGQMGSGPKIPPNSLLIFEIELIEIVDKNIPKPVAPAASGSDTK